LALPPQLTAAGRHGSLGLAVPMAVDLGGPACGCARACLLCACYYYRGAWSSLLMPIACMIKRGKY